MEKNRVNIATPEGRLRWVNVYGAKLAYNQVDMVHQATVLIPKDADFSEMEAARTKIAMAEFKKMPAGLRKLFGGQKPVFKDGDEYYASREDEKKEMYKEYKGCWYLDAEAPEMDGLLILDTQRQVVMDPADIYDGCYGRLILTMNTFTSKARKGYAGGSELSITLKGLQKTRDGEVLKTVSSTPLTEEDVANILGGAPRGAAGPVSDDIDDL